MEDKKNILKEASVLLIILVILSSNLFASAQIVAYNSLATKNAKIINTDILEDWEIIIDEGFKDSTIPPDWTKTVYNPSGTWHIEYDEYLSHSTPYCAVCYNNINLQDEWLITPMLNFSKYTIIRLSFWWMTDWWIATYDDECDLNVSISIDGGNTWVESLWCEDKYKDLPFEKWDWHDTDMGNFIDLSDYAGENNVKIGFQYYSDQNIDGCQIWLDDISVIGNYTGPNPVICDADGPYEGKAGDTVFFNCNASGGQKPYIYRWDFGDNTSYNYQQKPTHRYKKIGNFNVTLRVTDISIPRKFSIDYTTAVIIKPDPGPSRLNIENYSRRIGLQATIVNNGGDNITNIEWEIYVRGGPLGINIFDKVKNGTIDNLGPGESKIVRLRYFIGFGLMHVRITAVAGDIVATPRETLAWKWGPLVIVPLG